MTQSIKWLHLSDFHFGKNQYEQSFSTKKIIEHLDAQKVSGKVPDVIFITGDIANKGLKSEYEIFNNLLLKRLSETLGEGIARRIYMVPGNHDLDREVNPAFSKPKFLRVDSGAFYPTTESLQKRKMLVSRFQSYIDNAGHVDSLCFSDEAGAYVEECNINGNSVAIVGINTAWLCDGEDDKGNLTPGLQIVRDALEQTRNASIKFVLGHHPLSWLHDSIAQPLEVLFGEHNVIYLHGHMHKSWASPALSPTGDFISIQSGAAWQAPEGDKWKNGFLWGELSDDKQHIDLEPFRWSFPNQCWALSGETFHEKNRVGGFWRFNAPGYLKTVDYTPREKASPLIGWAIKSLDELESCTSPLKGETALRYFDGATPTWDIVLSDSIPRREIVKKLAARFESSVSDPIVNVLVGAGCEGKTTALLQSCLEILRSSSETKALIKTNHVRIFSARELLATLKTHDNWLIVVDEADQSAREILRFIDSGFDGYAGKINFLLASRDSDWISSGAGALAWDYTAKYNEVILKDLTASDAGCIVNAWEKLGVDGLGPELSALDKSKRAEKLRYYAKKEAKGNHGAFFGALLVARHGSDLLEHAEKMLRRLRDRQLGDDLTLMDALGYVAAMHSEGFDKLSFATLAGVLKLPVPQLMSAVIRPLGKEAAAATTSNLVFTRHKYIADAILEVLESRFEKDISNYFIDLALSEQDRYTSEQVLNIGFWLFDFSEGLFKSGKKSLAINIAKRLYENDDCNPYLLTKLASLYRRENNASEAILLFHEFINNPQHRGFYFEWGVCEGNERNYLENALLVTYAMSDDVEKAAIGIDQCYRILNGLSQCYNQLYNKYVDPVFEQASHAASSLLLTVEKKISAKERVSSNVSEFLKLVAKKRATVYERKSAIKQIKEAAARLKHYGVSDKVSGVAAIELVEFVGINTLLENVEMQLS